jgi:hypothetical protein
VDWAAARARLDAPLFTPLRAAIDRLPSARWPDHDDLTSAAEGVTTWRGMPLRFVKPREDVGSFPRGGQPPERERRYYEVRIAETGEVETRPENWHDLFNALAWLAYPRAKAAINAQHAAILEERGESEAKRRSPERDALTLFDEGGVAVMATDAAFFDLIRDFEWKRLFWERREELSQRVRFLAFGHALFEQALDPHIGMVAKTVFIGVDALPVDSALTAVVDRALVTHFKDRSRFPSAKAMAPMPVLGVPGWHPDTSREAFYDDRHHFRPKSGSRGRKMKG